MSNTHRATDLKVVGDAAETVTEVVKKGSGKMRKVGVSAVGAAALAAFFIARARNKNRPPAPPQDVADTTRAL